MPCVPELRGHLRLLVTGTSGGSSDHGGMTSTAGRLLVAVPTLADPNFARTVVFVVEHDANGALGLVLNRPSPAGFDDVVPYWHDLLVDPAVPFLGGPVQPEAALALARVVRVESSDGWQPLLGRVGTVDLSRRPDQVMPAVEAVRIFVGYAGWGSQQLDHELAMQGWYVVDAEVDDLLTTDPVGLWRAVLRRQGGDLATAANYPEDPSNN